MPKVRHQLDIHSNVMDKQDELQKKSTVYTTKRIEEIIKNEGNGKPDTTPFFHGQAEWRDSGVIFEYTDEELEELDKCSSNCTYFIENYCKFLNKKGRTLVSLRDYQKRLLNVLGGEHWDPKEEIIMPDHPEVVLMQSRQTGKCLTMSSSVDINGVQTKLYDLYFSLLDKKSVLDLVLYTLYKINDHIPLTRMIYLLEIVKYGKNYDKKLIETISCDFDVKTVNGYNKAVEFHRTKPFDIYKVVLENGMMLKCADEHLLYVDHDKGNQGWRFVKDLNKSDFVYTEEGWEKVVKIKKNKNKAFMCDITLND